MRLINSLKNRFNLKPPALAGLHITSSSFQLLQLSKAGDEIQVNQYAKVSFSIKEEPSNIIHAIKKLRDQQNVFQRVAVALPDHAVISKTIQLSSELNEIELAQIIPYELEGLPYPLQELYYDFQIINRAQAKLVDVLLVAAQKQNIEPLVNLINQTGLETKVVEAESHAIERACKFLLTHWLKNNLAQTTSILLLCKENLTFMVWREQQLIFSRSVSILSPEYSLSNILLQLRRTLQFFSASTQAATFEHFFVLGECAVMPELLVAIRSEFTMASDSIALPEKFNALAKEKLTRDVLICLGLALRGCDL